MKLRLLIATVAAGLFCTAGFAQDDAQNKCYNMSELDWKLWGYRPEVWRMDFDFKANKSNGKADIRGIDVSVPGSVQKALLDAGCIEDWNYGINNEKSEWIENRSWLFTARIPDGWIEKDRLIRLNCKGLDDNGTVLVNGKVAGLFNNTFIPYEFDITPLLNDKDNVVTIAFNMPTRYLGQIGWTSKLKDWKPRFYYGWDWMPRIVQIGVWDDMLFEVFSPDDARIENINVTTHADRYKDVGELRIAPEMTHAALRGNVKIELKGVDGKYLINEVVPSADLAQGKVYGDLKVKRWYPNGEGEQPLYNLKCTLTDEKGAVKEVVDRRVGFKSVVWQAAKNAPKEADPWICCVNNRPVFIQGINWTPIRPNFADLKEEQYRKLLHDYKEMGFNTIRIWGGGFPEKEWLYDICDEMGLMIQQDLPLSSSGLDNYPPDTAPEVEVMGNIARSYLKRNKHHASMLIWCGGNELYERGDVGIVTIDHPMIRRIADVAKMEDPKTRFIVASPSGANISAGYHNFGSGRNWDTHGPWTLPYKENDFTANAIEEYWQKFDGLMLSEMGAPGAMSVEMINKYKGNCKAMPASHDNPYWNQFNWWVEWEQFKREHDGIEPASLEEYVRWSQQNQINGLAIAMRNLKSKFPACGGLIIWMGHDSFPAPANTSIIDFDGNWKPVAYELQKILKAKK